MDPLVTIRPELLTLSPEQIQALGPLAWITIGSVVTLVLSVMRLFSPKWPVFLSTILVCVGGIYLSASAFDLPAVSLFNNMMVSDAFSSFMSVVFLASALLTVLASFRYLDREGLQHPEYYLLVLFSVIGMMLMVSALDLIVIFIALELMSLCVYSLVGFRRSDRKSNEASLKYFILGGAASALMLYGVALLYGSTASTNVRDVLAFVQASGESGQPLSMVFVLGSWLVIAGFLFKVASVPFHMWMPDVYEGAPVPVTGFMTTGLKAAAFGAFVRVFVSLGYGQSLMETLQTHFHHLLWASAVLTMLVGNVIALTQTNLKRMLAYSSIAHTGYILVGFLSGSKSEYGYSPILIYLVSYAIMNLGAFVVLAILARKGDEGTNLQDVAGVARRRPWLAFSMAVFLLSMAGIPPTAGFIAKYLLFYSAIQAGEILLVVLSVLCSAISVYYYLRVLVYMYMREPSGTVVESSASPWSAIAVASMVALTLQVGIVPSQLVEAAKRAILGL